MGMSKLYFVQLLIHLYFVSISISQPDFTMHFCIDTYGNYTNTSTYNANLKTFLSSITSDTQTNSGFYNLSVGQDPSRVNGIALCRGDVSVQDCHTCLDDSATKLPQICPTQKEAVGWYDNCMLRYSNRSILGISDEQHVFYLNNPSNVSNDADEFNKVLDELLSDIQSKASAGDSGLKFAVRQGKVDEYMNLYALAQCTPDLSHQSCSDCLGRLIRWIPIQSANSQGARYIGPSCGIRYETYQFYNLPSSPPPLSPPLSPPNYIHFSGTLLFL